MFSKNNAEVIGFLGNDPEVRYSPAGNGVANLRVATSERRKNKDGEYEDHTEWHAVVVLGTQVEHVAKLRKGAYILVEGRLQMRKWQDKEGADRYTTEIVANRVGFLEKKAATDTDNEPASEEEGF